MTRKNTNTCSSPTASLASVHNEYRLSGSSLRFYILSHVVTQVRRRTPTEQDHALCRQDRKVQVFSEGHWDGVHKEEDGGDVQHSSFPHCGSARVQGHAGHQHTTSPYRQNMVVCVNVVLCFSFFMSDDLLLNIPLPLYVFCFSNLFSGEMQKYKHYFISITSRKHHN